MADYSNNENAEMVINNNNQIKHHTDELRKLVTPKTEVPAWVVSKVGRSASDLSDATHYLDGASKYDNGGGVGKIKKKNFGFILYDEYFEKYPVHGQTYFEWHPYTTLNKAKKASVELAKKLFREHKKLKRVSVQFVLEDKDGGYSLNNHLMGDDIDIYRGKGDNIEIFSNGGGIDEEDYADGGGVFPAETIKKKMGEMYIALNTKTGQVYVGGIKPKNKLYKDEKGYYLIDGYGTFMGKKYPVKKYFSPLENAVLSAYMEEKFDNGGTAENEEVSKEKTYLVGRPEVDVTGRFGKKRYVFKTAKIKKDGSVIYGQVTFNWQGLAPKGETQWGTIINTNEFNNLIKKITSENKRVGKSKLDNGGSVPYDPRWAEMEAYTPYMSQSEYAGQLEIENAESLVRENLIKGEICICKLRKILGHEPAYPVQYVGNIKLTKCFLKPFYKI